MDIKISNHDKLIINILLNLHINIKTNNNQIYISTNDLQLLLSIHCEQYILEKKVFVCLADAILIFLHNIHALEKCYHCFSWNFSIYQHHTTITTTTSYDDMLHIMDVDTTTGYILILFPTKSTHVTLNISPANPLCI